MGSECGWLMNYDGCELERHNSSLRGSDDFALALYWCPRAPYALSIPFPCKNLLNATEKRNTLKFYKAKDSKI